MKEIIEEIKAWKVSALKEYNDSGERDAWAESYAYGQVIERIEAREQNINAALELLSNPSPGLTVKGEGFCWKFESDEHGQAWWFEETAQNVIDHPEGLPTITFLVKAGATVETASSTQVGEA